MKTLFLLPLLTLSAGVLAASPASTPHAGMNPPAMNAPAVQPLQQATVLSTLSAPPYLYIEAAQDKKILWLAANSIAVKKGDAIQFAPDMVMENFYSKTLKRSFPSVVFVSRVVVADKRK